MRKLSITIDGPAGAGKSTIAKQLADKLGYALIDTGAMYRSVTCAAILYQIDLNSDKKLADIARRLSPKFNNSDIDYYVDNLYLTPFIRGIAVSNNVSLVSTHKTVREELVKLQRKITSDSPKGSVMEGRDTGSTVLPNADIKIFLTAGVEERANRRHQQLAKQGLNIPITEIIDDIKRRDKIDSEREISPLTIPAKAHIIDSSILTVENVVDIILSKIVEEQSK